MSLLGTLQHQTGEIFPDSITLNPPKPSSLINVEMFGTEWVNLRFFLLTAGLADTGGVGVVKCFLVPTTK